MKWTLGLLLLVTSCTPKLVKDASCAYQYQKEIYQAECPLPPKPRSDECAARDAKLTEAFKYLNAAESAIDVSHGGALPADAVTKLKEIKKEMQCSSCSR